MDRAPIPPHERSWRHPSELGPTPSPGDTSSTTRSSARLLLLAATGAVAAALVAVVALTTLPEPAPAPVAVSATTMPPFAVSGAGGSTAATAAPTDDDAVKIERSALASPTGLLLTGAPRAVAAPLADQPTETGNGAGTGTGTETAPAGDTTVHVVTTSHVYRLTWSDLDRVVAPDGTVVVDDVGRLLGTFADGRFVAD